MESSPLMYDLLGAGLEDGEKGKTVSNPIQFLSPVDISGEGRVSGKLDLQHRMSRRSWSSR